MYKEINHFTKPVLKETLWPILRNNHKMIKKINFAQMLCNIKIVFV